MLETDEIKADGIKAGKTATETMQHALEAKNAGLDTAARVIADALNAKSVKQFHFQGEVVDAKAQIDHKTRLEAAKMVIDIFGAKAAEKHEISGKNGKPIKFVVNMTDE